MPEKPSKTVSTRRRLLIVLTYINRPVFVTFFLTFVSACFILFRFNQVPAYLAFDEVEFARIALGLQDEHYIPYTTAANGHATMYYYVIACLFAVFGVSETVLRLPSAAAGIVSVLLFYAVLKRLNTPTVIAIGAPMLMASARWYYSFARFSFEAPFLLMLELGSAYFLVEYVKSRKYRWVVGSAVLAGLVFHSYQPGRIYFLLPLVILLLINRRAAALFGVICAAVASPLLLYLTRNPDTRITQLSIFSSVGWMNAIFVNMKRVTLMFISAGDGNGRHNFPFKTAVNPLFALLAVSGAAIGASGRRNRLDMAAAAWLLLALLPSLFVNPGENPNMLRTYSALPALAYFAARTLGYVYTMLKRYGTAVAIAAVALFILATAAYDARTYFVFQSRVSRNAFEVTCPLAEVLKYNFRTVADLPDHCRADRNLF